METWQLLHHTNLTSYGYGIFSAPLQKTLQKCFFLSDLTFMQVRQEVDSRLQIFPIKSINGNSFILFHASLEATHFVCLISLFLLIV